MTKILAIANVILLAFTISIHFKVNHNAETLNLLAQFPQYATQNAKDISSLTDMMEIRDITNATVTAYTPSKEECDNDPEITASMRKVKPGTVAVSHDLFKSGWVFGKKIYIENLGIFEINDLMNRRWNKRIDIVMFDKKQARKFGKKNKAAALLQI